MNPWENEQLFDLLSDIVSLFIFVITISIALIYFYFGKKIKTRNFCKMIFIDLIIIISSFYIIFYWYIAVPLHILSLIVLFHVERLEAIKTYKNEMIGIYNIKVDTLIKKRLIKKYDNVIPNGMDLYKYIIPNYQIIILGILLPATWIIFIYLFGNSYFFL